MHPVLQRIIDEARKTTRRIVLPESTDERMIVAARKATDEKIARISLVGKADDILKTAKTLESHFLV